MVRYFNRTIAGFCLVSLLVYSCESYDDSGEIASSDPDTVSAVDAFPDQVSTTETEFFRAAHILITWSTSTEDSMSDDDGNALRVIRNIQDEILSGQATFEEMAFNYSHCTSSADSGRLPAFTRGAITEELDSTIAALSLGEISGIIRTRFGYHLVKRLGN